MSCWKKLFSHPDFDSITGFYSNLFPLEVRYVCADWLEDRIKTDLFIDIRDPQIEKHAANFLGALIQQVELEKQTLDQLEFWVKYRLDEAIKTYKEHLHKPFFIYKQIRDVMMKEQNFLENLSEKQEVVEINEKLKNLQNEVRMNKEKQTDYKEKIEQLKILEYDESSKQMLQLNNPQAEERRFAVLEECRQKKYHMSEFISTSIYELGQRFSKVIASIDDVQTLVILNRLGKWRRDQILSGNGASLNVHTLDEIQSWFEQLAAIIWTTRSSIDEVIKLTNGFSTNMSQVFQQPYVVVTNLMQNLIVAGFVIEKHPPQVMKTNTRFAATVRLLTANLGIHLNTPFVDVSILSESQCQKQQMHAKPLDKVSGGILNSTGNLEYQPSKRHLVCNLSNMQVKKIKRAEKKGSETTVTDEKFALLFKSTIRTADIQINVWVMSLPVVVTVHGNQEPQSWATVTWDNAFSEICRVPFEVVDKVNWSHMSSVLNMKFTSQTGKCLTEDNLHVLYEKAFRTTVDFYDRTISWAQFCKEPLPGRTFTFWDWFYAAMKLTKEHLRGPWMDGLITGFINRDKAEEILHTCVSGTFLLRFSDSEIGGVSIAWVDYSPIRRVVSLHPFCGKDFGIRSLADRIKDLPQCVTLYPNIPKDTAFEKYYSPIGEKTINGYVKSILKTTVPDHTFAQRCISDNTDLQRQISSWIE